MAAIIVRDITIEEFTAWGGEYAEYLDGTGQVDEVVQCKDCVYYANRLCSRWGDGTIMRLNDYCSRGAMKEVKEDDKG